MKLHNLQRLQCSFLAAILTLALGGRPAAAQDIPTMLSVSPQPGSPVLGLTLINVIFNETVIGVTPSSLLINGSPASDVVTNDPNDYTFFFAEPTVWPAQIAWAPDQTITDTSTPPFPFAGGNWSYTLDTNINTQVIISEFMASNKKTILDDTGTSSDWIELFNGGTVQASLDGWFLTDDPANLTKWQFPVGTPFLQVGSFMLVWASGLDHTNPLAPLHTNFKLSSADGSYLALVDPLTNVVSSFDPYPAQFTDVSYGRDSADPTLVGYFLTPTPGKRNSSSGSGFTPDPIFSVDSGIYTNDSLTVTILSSFAPPGSTIRYTLNAGVPGTNSPLYTAPITFSTNVIIKVRVFPPSTTNLFPSSVIAKNYIFLDSTDMDFSSNIPLLVISTQGQPISQNFPPGVPRIEGTMAIINVANNGRAFLNSTPEVITCAGFELYGQTSIGFAKKPYRIETHDALTNGLNIPLLGLPSNNDWKLRNPFDDKTLMNDFLGYELFEKMGNYSCRRRFVEVFVDTGGGRLRYPDDYTGVEVLFETITIDKDRVDIPKLTTADITEPNVTGGWIIKKDKDSIGDLNFSTTGSSTLGFPAEALKIHRPNADLFTKTAGQTTTWPGPYFTPSGSNQVGYIVNYLNQMEKALYAPNWLSLTGTNHYSYYLDTASFIDFFWVVEFTRQIDGIRLSSYFHKDREGKLMAGPVWDWNLSFGNANYNHCGITNGWYYSAQDDGIGPNEDIWLRRLVNGDANMGAELPDHSGEANSPTGGDPDFNQKIVDRWSVLRTNVLNGTNVLRRMDELSTMLNEACQRDLWGKWRSQIVGVYQWPNPAGTAGSFEERDVDYVHPMNYLGNDANSIIFQLKRWMLGRYIWIDNQFTPVPTFNAAGGEVTNGFQVTVTPPPGATLYYTLNGADPRAPGGSVLPGTSSNSGPATVTINSNVRIMARAKKAGMWYNTWGGPSAITLFTVIPSLRITEIMYQPPPAPPPVGSTNTASDFAYIEVKNIGGAPLNINQFTLNGVAQFQFPNVTLAAGQLAVVVANTNAFLSRYTNTPAPLILGIYAGSLTGGGHLLLAGAVQESILDFTLDPAWYPTTEGLGFSLVTVDETAATSAWNSAAGWRPSSAVLGSPGQIDPPPPLLPGVLVNEVLANQSLPGGDAIELYNPTGSPADITGWFLTDDFSNNPRKYAINSSTIIPAGGFEVLYSSNSFGAHFRLNAAGGSVYLFSGDGTNLTGYAHGISYGYGPRNSSFGRYIPSTGAEQIVVQVAPSPGGANLGPLVGPIVISEINYHPPDVVLNGIAYDDTLDEFIELENISSNDVLLYDNANPADTWQLANAVTFDFPTGVTVPAGGFVLVVGFDPAADTNVTAGFRARNFVPDNVPLYGSWQTNLDNGGGSIQLFQPDTPLAPGLVPYILVDRVDYSNVAPWAPSADGFGLTLHRIVPSSYGNDPTNWVAAAPSPGTNYVAGGTPPVLTSQPGNQYVVAGTNITLSATATGTAPVRFQWRFNDANIYGANDPTLALTNFQFSQSGTYNVLVYNSAGVSLGTNFTLTARTGLKITLQPTNRVVIGFTTTNLTVAAVGSFTVRYQWRFNGTNIPGATATNLTFTNIQASVQGSYDCLVSDDFNSTVSQSAFVTVIFRPGFVQHPLSQTAVAGSSVTFTVAGVGTPPLGFGWRRSLQPMTGSFSGFIVSAPTYSFLTLTNLQPSNAVTYTVTLTNLAGFATNGVQGVLSSNAVLTVLADTAHSGLPDVYATNTALHPCFTVTNLSDPSVGALDSDGDGMSNAAEYFAGTDPCNPASNLKLTLTGLTGGTMQFTAVSNRTYTVQYSDGLNPPQWRKLADVMARNVTHLQIVTDTNPPVVLTTNATDRVYRVVTPIQP